MIKNDIYTYDYFQPEDYRFSLDSVFLAQKVAQLIQNQSHKENWNVLDLCSGCGIIGLELSLHVPSLRTIDFLEIQNIYREYFDKNIKLIYGDQTEKKLQFREENYSTLLVPEKENTYDLIISNPPYFFKGEGMLSPNDFKNRCRFFLDSDFATLFNAILHALKPGRSAYILVRKGTHHGRNPLADIQSILKEKALAQVIDEVRGTHIVEIFKKDQEIF